MRAFMAAGVLAFWGLGFTALPALAQQTPAEAQKAAESVDLIEKNLTAGKAVLVDVRESRETKQGYIDGAILIPLSVLQEGKETKGFGKVLAQRLAKRTMIYTYCASGHRAVMAADILKTFGYDARGLKHGYRDLVKEGFITAKPKQ